MRIVVTFYLISRNKTKGFYSFDIEFQSKDYAMFTNRAAFSRELNQVVNRKNNI